MAFLAEHVAPWPDWTLAVPELSDIPLREAYLPPALQSELADMVGATQIRQDRYTRILHSVGRNYRDLIRVRLGRVNAPPDAVVYPANHEQVMKILEAAGRYHAAIVPYGGGSSVVGGVELEPGVRPNICLDLTEMNQVLSIDDASLAARFQCGIRGPELEKVLNERGFTLGHFPGSFEFSTLGGWIATRGAGYKSTKYGKMEDLVLSLRLATPAGDFQTPLVPAAAGGDLVSLLVGSEGGLGVITEAVVSIRPIPPKTWFAAYLFPDFRSGTEAVRTIMAGELVPAMLRLSDHMETSALMSETMSQKAGPISRVVFQHLAPRYYKWRGVSTGTACLLSAAGEGRTWGTVTREKRAVDLICGSHGGVKTGSGPALAWHKTTFTSPYLRDELITRGFLVETLETAATWNDLHQIYGAVVQTIGTTLNWSGVSGVVMTHLSHTYRAGANLNFTFICPQVRGREEEQWLRAKKQATRTMASMGGAISHHHGVGRDNKPWIGEYWDSKLLNSFKAIKNELDPLNILNPGVILDVPPNLPDPPLKYQPFSPRLRELNIERLGREVFDLLVVGGGIVGAGVAWDACLRGLSVALVEKNDFAGGTSGKSSRMIHGGLRYLKMLDLKLVRESLAERQTLMAMAPHLVRPVANIIPVYKGEGDSRTVLHWGLWGYDTLAGSRGLPPHQSLSAEELVQMEPSVSPDGLEGGLLYYDGLTDDARLTLEIAKAASGHGGVLVNHVEVTGVQVDEDSVETVVVNHLSGQKIRVKSRILINAAGVWADLVRMAAAPESPRLLRPSKGIHITFPRALKPIDHVVILKGHDGRPLFAVPHQSVVYVGTTDEDYDGDIDSIHATAREVDYLIEAVNRVLAGPPLTKDQVISTWAGVRPLLLGAGKSDETKDVSREHELHTEFKRLITICGGKLTTFRLMAAQTVDAALNILKENVHPRSATDQVPICGPIPEISGPNHHLIDTVWSRLTDKYGPQASLIADVARNTVMAQVLDEELGLIAAEVYWSVQGEMGLTLNDVMIRRLGLAYMTADHGLQIAPKVAGIMAGLLDWNHEKVREQLRLYQDFVGLETGFKIK
jgi:alkyldihydroxyacetonephosphate synthase